MIDADATGFDDPKFAFDCFVFERASQRLHKTVQVRVRRSVRETEDSDAGIAAGKEDERIGRIEVKGHEATAFRTAVLDQIRVAPCCMPCSGTVETSWPAARKIS